VAGAVHRLVWASQLSPAQHFLALPFFGFLQEPPGFTQPCGFFFFFLPLTETFASWSRFRLRLAFRSPRRASTKSRECGLDSPMRVDAPRPRKNQRRERSAHARANASN
jgi:hypothetical protein